MNELVTENLIGLSIDIEAYKQECYELIRVINQLDKAIIMGADRDEVLYMQESIDRYKEVIRKLKILFECYFKEELDNNIPVNFHYRRDYKKLLKAF